MNTEDLIERVRQAYAGAVAYRDHGFVTLTADDGEVEAETAIGINATFKTAFARSRALEFEYRRSRGDFDLIRATEGLLVEYVAMGQKVREATSLMLAIAGLTGITWGVAHTVSRLLMPREIEGVELWNLGSGHVVWKRREIVEGDACSVLLLGNDRTEVAVRETDFAVRRVVQRDFMSVKRTYMKVNLVITYHPTILTERTPG
jgi:hypothetical protein